MCIRDRSGMIHGATLAPPVFRLPFSPEINQELPVDLINYTQLSETSAEPNPPLPYVARFFIVGVVGSDGPDGKMVLMH